jgi:predicted nucleic acid-binding protein
VRLFLDTSVLLAGSGSVRGASRELFRLAPQNGWTLVATPYVIEEVLRNLPALALAASSDWVRMRADLHIEDDIVTIDRGTVFAPAKDRPILFSALAWADVLLTLDRGDFEPLGGEFYGLAILTPGSFLQRERTAGRVKTV